MGHVLPNDLAPDPNWVSPGGINGATQRELLGDADANSAGEFGGHDQRPSTGIGNRPLGLEGPPSEDPRRGLRGRERPYVEDPLGDDPLDKPLHADRPAPEWGLRSDHYRNDRYRTGSRSSWAAAAAYGPEPRRPHLAGGLGSHPGGGLTYGSTIRPGGLLPPVRWRRSRVPLILVVGLTLFAVIALLVNLGTTARARFSAVSVDATFISQANFACAAALGSGRLGSKTVMTGGTATGTQTGTSTSARPASGGVPPSAETSGSHSAVSTAAVSSAQLARLNRLATRLGHIRPTPAAAPEVKVWLGDWRHYLADERNLQKANAVHNSAQAGQDIQKADVAAANADLFAADNSLSDCAIDSGAKPGFEPIP
jgi:hypothetical protein